MTMDTVFPDFQDATDHSFLMTDTAFLWLTHLSTLRDEMHNKQ